MIAWDLYQKDVVMKKMLLLLGCLNFAGFVCADQTSQNGAYINANFGAATLQYLPTGSFIFVANAGYNFNRGFALEGGYSQLTSSQFGATQTNNIFDVAAKGTIHLSNIFALYGRLGTGINYMSWGGTATDAPGWFANQRSSNNFMWLAAGGASFTLSKHFDLRLEDTLYIPMGGGNSTAGTINAVTGGVQFNF